MQIYDDWKDAGCNSLPHFGKFVPNFARDDVSTLLRSHIDDFRQLRLSAQLDSIDLFTNAFLDDVIFYDVTRTQYGGDGTLEGGAGVPQASALVWLLLVLILIFK